VDRIDPRAQGLAKIGARVHTLEGTMTDFTPQNPDYAEVVAASFARQGLMRALGIELTEVGPGRCVLVAGRDPGLLQQHGYFHGALIGAMLDCAGGYAAYSLMPPGSEVLTAEYKVNFLTAAEGERLVVRGKVVKPGRTLTVTTAEAFCAQGGVEQLCAVMLQSLIRVPAKP
jgi:uncharacterized protein (TIGR00369 family)